jgi:amino acid adenylation domain-containing protein/non-ribosomal peptide synthase protein (TIGR01720 family)
VELTPRDLFDAPTIAGLAEIIARSARRMDSPPIEPVSRDGELQLSFAQQRLWFFQQLVPGSAAYNVPVAVRLGGPLDVAALRRAFIEIVRRHEVLRTRFPSIGGLPVQSISTNSRMSIPLIDLIDVGEANRDHEVGVLVRSEARRPFDLAAGPLIRACLLRLGARDHVIVFVTHHIVSDGWSMGVFVQELATLYSAFRVGLASPLDELRIQYADFAQWQRRWLRGEALERQVAYWREQLLGVPPLLLPLDRPRPPIQSFRGAKLSRPLSSGMAGKLRVLGHREGVTLFMALLAAFDVVLSRWSRQDDVVVGSAVANRTRREIEPLIGFFVNSLVLRTRIGGDSTFGDLLRAVRETALGAYAHQELPFEKLVQELHPTRDLAREPLFQVMFTHSSAPSPTVQLPGEVTLQAVDVEGETAKFDLTVAVWEGGDELAGVAEYSTDLFDEATIARILGHFEHLLCGVVENPSRRVSQLSLLSDAERRQLLEEWNPPRSDFPGGLRLPVLFARQARLTPHAVAATYGDRALTYGELDRRADLLAGHLCAKGVAPEVPVGVCLERSPELLLAVLGILKAGGYYVPLDPEDPPSRLEYVLEDLSIRLVLTREGVADRVPGEGRAVIRVDADEPFLPVAQPRVPQDDGANALAYAIYTSGSTGQPKGVGITHEAVSRLVLDTNYVGISAEDRIGHASAPTFDAATFEIWGALLNGACLVVLQKEELVDLDSISRRLNEEAVDVLFLTTALFNQLAHERPSIFATLRSLLFGGEAADPAAAREVLKAGPPERLIHVYGPTETTTFASWHVVRDVEIEAVTIPIGLPISKTSVHVTDDYANLSPVGVPGELWIGGPGVARGYLGRPAATAERFVPDAFGSAAGGRCYRTGDLCRRRADGSVEFLRRLDQQVKLRGFRIELGEIEAKLAEHPDIRAAAVVLRQDASGRKRLVAYVSPTRAAMGGDFRRYLAERLPGYMLPSDFVELEQMPLNRAGKIERAALPEPERARPALSDAYVAPRDTVEERIARLWAEVLLIDRVGIHDNFFELGGDSILAIQVVARAHQRQLNFAPRQIFEHQTVAELARVARTDRAVQTDPGAVVGPVPLTAIQHWFFGQELAEPHHFNQAALLELHRAVDGGQLRSAIRKLLAHHDALRLRFERQPSGWRQWVAAPDDGEADEAFVQIDLGNLTGVSQTRALEAAATEVQRSLDLGRGPLVRLALFHLGTGGQRLLLVLHHLAVDGVSWRILQQDLLAAYERVDRGDDIDFTPKTTSFKHWAERVREYAKSHALEDEIGFWREVAGVEVAPLPLDRDAGVNDVASTDVVTVALDADETRDLLQKVPAVYRTRVNDALLTAAAMAFARWTGRRSFSFWLEGHGREDLFDDVDVSRTVGWFTSVFPVVLDVEDARDPGEALRSVKEQIRRIPGNGIGYGLLRYLRGDAELAQGLGAAAPQVSFNYLGRFDAGGGSAPVGAAAESAGQAHGPGNRRAQLLEINGSTVGERLQLRFIYSSNLHNRSTIERLAGWFIDSLRELTAHCLASEVVYTPSDFPLTNLDQATLDRLTRGDRNLEDLYPASPMQAGLLFHTILENVPGMYFEQFSGDLVGALSVEAFRRAWQRVVDAHAILRTQFVWEDLTEPLQVVRSNIELPWDERDFRGMSEPERETALGAYLEEDRRRGFDPGRAPLMRAGLIRLRDDTWRFVWSFHHLLLDGWSVPLVLRQMMSYYSAFQTGQPPSPELGPQYREFIAWIRAQELSRAEAFWRSQFAGFTRPTLLARSAGRGPGNAGTSYNSVRASLELPATAMLRSLAREQRLSLNTLVQGAWALLLSDRTGEADVIFGTTSAGRPASLRGVESMVGLFINTLPLRLAVRKDAALGSWLQEIQRRHSEAREYEFTPLLSILEWSGVARGSPLFDTHQVFDNYPVDRSVEGVGHVALAVTNIRTYTRANFPLSLVAAAGEDSLSLKLLYDAEAFERETIEQILAGIEAILKHMGREPQSSLGDLLEALAESDRRFEAELRRKLERSTSEMFTRARRRAVSVRSDDGYGEGGSR